MVPKLAYGWTPAMVGAFDIHDDFEQDKREASRQQGQYYRWKRHWQYRRRVDGTSLASGLVPFRGWEIFITFKIAALRSAAVVYNGCGCTDRTDSGIMM